jgi:hypothetical protein
MVVFYDPAASGSSSLDDCLQEGPKNYIDKVNFDLGPSELTAYENDAATTPPGSSLACACHKRLCQIYKEKVQKSSLGEEVKQRLLRETRNLKNSDFTVFDLRFVAEYLRRLNQAVKARGDVAGASLATRKALEFVTVGNEPQEAEVAEQGGRKGEEVGEDREDREGEDESPCLIVQ